MNSRCDIFSDEWCNLIFEGKNHEYGAYSHRTNSIRRHFQAMVIAVSIFLVGATTPALLHRILPQNVDKDLSTRIISVIEMEKPAIENVLKVIPPPSRELLRNMIKFTPYKIKPDDEIDDSALPKMQQDIINSGSAIGNHDFTQGTNNPDAPLPTTVENSNITGETDKPVIIADQMPQFPGGINEMFRFIKDHLHYPVIAQELGVSGTVIINFVVDRDGKISNIVVTRSIGSGCDEEAMRVLGIMPRWSPGKQAGNPVRVMYSLPFKFVIQK